MPRLLDKFPRAQVELGLTRGNLSNLEPSPGSRTELGILDVVSSRQLWVLWAPHQTL